MTKPRVLFIDIETLPNVCHTFDIWQPIKPNAIIQEKSIITFSYKWLGNTTVKAIKGKPYDDKELVEKIGNILKDADYVVGHYLDKFDMRFIRSRTLFHRLPPIPPVATIDTYKLAKKYFHLNANRLDYLGQYLNVGRKIKTSFELWSECAKGKRKAIHEMAEYNKQDVQLLEDVFLAMLPYVESNLNHKLFNRTAAIVCPHCGSEHTQKRGFVVNKVTRRQRYSCLDCGSWFSERLVKND